MEGITKKQISTILFADIVGYTAAMTENESKALDALENFKFELEEQVPKFNGAIKNFYGDGCLVAFQNTDDAIHCAKILQENFQKKYNLPVRIGLDRGAVVFKDGNVFGDAVNLASRIEAISLGGGILFSKTIFEDLKDHSSFPSKSLGIYRFKNIKTPQEVFGISLPNFPLPSREKILRHSKIIYKNKNREYWKSFALGASILAIVLLSLFILKNNNANNITDLQKDTFKSIAVLPFRNLSDHDKNRHFGDGMMDAILDHLSRIESLRVTSRTSAEKYRNTELTLPQIAKNLNVKYVLEGTVQQYGDKMRIIAQLIELPADRHLWSKQYDESLTLENILNIQKEVSTSIVKELKIRLNPDVLEQIEKIPTNNFKAYEAYLKAKEHVVQYYTLQNFNELDTAAELFKAAIQLDDDFAESYIGLASAYWMRNYNHNYFQRNFLDSALLYADKALSINPYLADGYQMRGSYFFEQSQFALAEQNFRRTLELEPNNPYTTTNLGLLTYFINGNYSEGYDLFNRALELEATNNLPDVHEKLAMLYLDIGEFEKAEFHFNAAKKLLPNSAGTGWAYHAQGKFEIFKTFYENFLDTFPDMKNSIPDLALGYVYSNEIDKALEIWKPFIQDLDSKGNEHYMNRVRSRYGYSLWKKGEKEEARKQFELSSQYHERSILMGRVMGSGGSSQYELAGNNAFLGNKEKAYEWLEEFNTTGWKWGSIHFIQVDPLFDNLREDERFQKMINAALAEKAKIRKELKEIKALKG